MNLGELFHSNKPQGWMARPTIRSTLYNITASGGFDPDILVVVFDPTTSQATIDSIINGGNFAVEFRYPKPPPQLYEVRLPVNMSLRDAHSYFRGFSQVLAAAPSARLLPQLTPSEGTPQPLQVIGAETGWDKGTGLPNAVLAAVSPGQFFIEASDLWPNIWLNQEEILAVCGTKADCDPDMDGFVTLKDFNHMGFKGVKPPDVEPNGLITCADLLAPGSPYRNNLDDPCPNGPPCKGNGFPDDLCGWNFSSNSGAVIGPNDHDTGVAGILAAIANNEPPCAAKVNGMCPSATHIDATCADGCRNDGTPPLGTVGTCWNCRVMPVVATAKGVPMGPGMAEATTGAVVAAFAYARQNGAHVVNFSAGLPLTPSDKNRCPNRARKVDKAAYSTVVSELNDLVTKSLGDIKPPVPLFTLAGGECNPGEDAGSINDDYYHWPTEAFFSGGNSKQVSVTVAATANSGMSAGGLAGYSDFGGPFEIAAPGSWTVMLDGAGGHANSGGGTSFAAPIVGGVGGLIVSDNLVTFATPDGAALKKTLLSKHTIVDSVGLKLIPGSRLVTMSNLP